MQNPLPEISPVAATPKLNGSHHHPHRPGPAAPTPEHRVLLLFSALCGLFTIAGWMYDPSLKSLIFFFFAFFFGAWHAGISAAHNLRRGSVDVHLLMIVVAVGAYLIGSHVEGGILLFLFSLSHGLETLAEYRTERAIRDLYRSYPQEALRRKGGDWERIPVEQLLVQDEVLVRPGDMIPCDGNITEGSTSIDESALSGESTPVSKGPSDKIFGGTTNLDGQVILSVSTLPQQSAVARVMGLIDDARKKKAPAQRFTDMIGRTYTVIVLGASVVAFFAFLLLGQMTVHEAFYRAMVLLVVSSPCALVISIPSAILAAIAAGARRGVLFRGGRAIEELTRINRFALDKTGTVTLGKLRVEGVVVFSGTEQELLSLGASAERHLTHPLAQAIVSEALARGFTLHDTQDVTNSPGRGVVAQVNGKSVYVGSRAYVASGGFELPPADEKRAFAEVYIASENVRGVVLLRDELRANAAQTITELRESGAKVSLLSGDKAAVVQEVAGKLGIEDFQAALSPSDKLRLVRQWQEAGERVAMTGDGINDAPSLAAADVSVVLGDRASDLATEQADVVLMGGQIRALPAAIRLSRQARRVIIQNLVLSLSVVVVLVMSTLFGKISLTTGVLGHEGSTVLVVLNSLRLLAQGSPKPRN